MIYETAVTLNYETYVTINYETDFTTKYDTYVTIHYKILDHHVTSVKGADTCTSVFRPWVSKWS